MKVVEQISELRKSIKLQNIEREVDAKIRLFKTDVDLQLQA